MERLLVRFMVNKICFASISVMMAVFFALIGPCAYAQGNIDIPQPKPKPKPKPAISVKLAAEKSGERVYYTTTEWNKLPIEEKIAVTKIGLVIGQGENAFLLSLFNNMGRRVCSHSVPFREAFNKTGNQLPTKAQMQTIKNNRRRIGDALDVFGGDHICASYFWCKVGSYLNLGTSLSYNGLAMYRIATSDIESGFNDVPAIKLETNEFDYRGGEIYGWMKKGNGYLQIVGAQGKYGLIDEDGRIVIPLKYDDIDGGIASTTDESSDTHPCWSGEGLMSVCINSNWGYINRDGTLIVPAMFDKVADRCYEYAAIQKEKLYGFIDNKGKIIYPIELSEVEPDYYDKKRFYAKKEGKYGFFNKDFQMVIPFKYDFVTGFRRGEDLCGVGINGKYGYIDRDDKVVIPLIFDFAEEFYHGLAAIVKDKKLGFINTKGEIVCQPQFYVDYVSYGHRNGMLSSHRTRIGYLEESSFRYSPYIAFVSEYTSYNYGIINREGTLITPFKYSRVLNGSYDGYTVEYEGEKLFLDIAGNEYGSEEERNQKSDSLLAAQGYREGQFRYGKKIIDSDHEKGLEYILKSATQDYVLAITYLAEDSKREKDYNSAYEFYVKAVDLGDTFSALELGDLCFDNSIWPDANQRALEWYQRYLAYQLGLNDSYCLYKIGLIYYYGNYGVSKSYENAVKFFSESHSYQACYYLGWMYEFGQGVKKDYNMAITYYKDSNGNRDADERIKKLQAR